MCRLDYDSAAPEGGSKITGTIDGEILELHDLDNRTLPKAAQIIHGCIRMRRCGHGMRSMSRRVAMGRANTRRRPRHTHPDVSGKFAIKI
jgi:hypothetical protein